MPEVDETDLKILREMQRDGGLTVSQLADNIGLSQSPCSRRIARLQSSGFILGRSVKLDRRKLGFDATIVARIKLSTHNKDILDKFKEAIRGIPEIQIAILLLGDYDFHLRVVVRDMDHYQKLLLEELTVLPGVREIQSSVILEVVKDSLDLPL